MMFWMLLLLMAGQLFFMAKAIENIPFFLYNMYSKRHERSDSISILLIKTKDGYFDHKQLSDREDELLMNTVGYYIGLKQKGDGTAQTLAERSKSRVSSATYNFLQGRLVNDSTAINNFPQWWAKYFISLTNNKYGSVEVVQTNVLARSPYTKSATDSLIFQIKLK